MITKDNILEVVKSIGKKDKKRIRNNWKFEYIVLYLCVVNVGSFVTIRLTNDYNRYKNVSKDGNCILSIDDDVFLSIK